MHTRRTAFTLIELLVVIVIIGLLTAVATASFSSAQRASRDSARKTEVSSIATAVEAYYRDAHTFPGTLTAPAAGTCEARDTSDSSISYSYVPARDCGTAAPFVSTDAAPTWIPGLGAYMSAAPIDKGFRDANGHTYQQILGGSATYSAGETWTAYDSSATNQTRTYTYRHLNGGYIIYTRLEAPATDTVAGPLSGTGVNVLGNDPTQNGNGNVYAIRR